jgi:hypothetical protein
MKAEEGLSDKEKTDFGLSPWHVPPASPHPAISPPPPLTVAVDHIKKDNFDMNDYVLYIRQVAKIGGVKSIIRMQRMMSFLSWLDIDLTLMSSEAMPSMAASVPKDALSDDKIQVYSGGHACFWCQYEQWALIILNHSDNSGIAGACLVMAQELTVHERIIGFLTDDEKKSPKIINAQRRVDLGRRNTISVWRRQRRLRHVQLCGAVWPEHDTIDWYKSSCEAIWSCQGCV